MASFLFKSVMLVLLVSYVCSGYIANAKQPELSETTILTLETEIITVQAKTYNSAGPSPKLEAANVIKSSCLTECQNTQIPEHLIEFCMENCNVRLTTKLEEDGFDVLVAELA